MLIPKPEQKVSIELKYSCCHCGKLMMTELRMAVPVHMLNSVIYTDFFVEATKKHMKEAHDADQR